MIEIEPVSPTYSIKPAKKIIPEEKSKQQSANSHTEKHEQDEEIEETEDTVDTEETTKTPSQHIDEIV